MKTKMIMLMLLSSTAFAHPGARYHYTAKCYVVETNSRTYLVHHYGKVEGMSGYDCANALDNLNIACDLKAKADGFISGSIYKDILITGKSYRDTKSYASSSGYVRRGFFGMVEHGRTHSSGTSYSISAATSVVYHEVDPNKDCQITERFQQDDVPTEVNLNFGG